MRFDKAVLILTRGAYTPVALKIVDVTGAEMVHVFTDVQINVNGIPKSNPFARVESLDRPKLEGHRQILPPAVASPGNVG